MGLMTRHSLFNSYECHSSLANTRELLIAIKIQGAANQQLVSSSILSIQREISTTF